MKRPTPKLKLFIQAIVVPTFAILNAYNAPAYAAENANLIANSYHGFPYAGRTITEGTWGEQSSYFNGDFMIPLIGNNSWIGYIDGAGKYGDDDAWFIGAGAGVRALTGGNIWGAYAFADMNRSIYNREFWIANPGIEWMSTIWDAHLNGYIPTKKSRSFGIVSGESLGLNTVQFGSHTIADSFYNVLEATGPGLDAEVGYTLRNFYNVRTYLGGYHFNITGENNINGVEGGIELPISRNFTLAVHDAYDKIQRNSIMGTLRVTLDGNPVSSTNLLQNRLMDPIRRNLGSQQTGNSAPIVLANKYYNTRDIATNAWFFSPGGAGFAPANGFSNCTIFNPCGVLSQATIDGINALSANATLVFNSGTFANPAPGTGFNINNGQSLVGRTNNFRQMAFGANRPLINDTLILNGNNNVNALAVNGLTTTSGARTAVRIALDTTGIVNISNSQINTTVNGVNISATGVLDLATNAQVNLINNQISAELINSPGNVATGIVKDNDGFINIFGGSVSSFASNANANTAISLVGTGSGISYITNVHINVAGNLVSGGNYGFSTVNAGTAYLTNNTINVAGDNSLETGVQVSNSSSLISLANRVNIYSTNSPGVSIGFYTTNNANLISQYDITRIQSNRLQGTNGYDVQSNSTLLTNNAQLTINGSFNDFVKAFNVDNSQLTVNNSNFEVFANNARNVQLSSYGIDATQSVVNLNGVGLNINSIGPENQIFSYGVSAQNSTTVNYQNSTFSASIIGGTSGSGLAARAGTTFVNLGNNQCITNNNGTITTASC